jgi:hypothetical protein
MAGAGDGSMKRNGSKMRALSFAVAMSIGLSLLGGKVHAAPVQNAGSGPAAPSASPSAQFGERPTGSVSHGDSHNNHDFDHDRDGDHRHNDHDRLFFGGVAYPWIYPYYGTYAGYAPDAYYNDTSDAANNPPPPSTVSDQATSSPSSPSGPNDYQLGTQWAQDLRRDIVIWDGFVNYVRSNILTALPSDEAEFRKGFISAYGINAEAAFNKAAEQAGEVIPKGPKIIYMGPGN